MTFWPYTGASWRAWLVWAACAITWVPLKLLGALDVSWWAIGPVLVLWAANLAPEWYDGLAD